MAPINRVSPADDQELWPLLMTFTARSPEWMRAFKD